MSIVDYINSRGGDSSFEARKLLWTYWKPNETYTGTAAQNTELLEALQRHYDSGPTVEAVTPLVDAGAEVKVKCDRDVTMSSFLSTSSFNASAGDEVSIGNAKVGSFVLQATDGSREFIGEVFIWPNSAGTQLEVQLLEGSVTDPDAAAPTPEEKALFEKFIDGVTSDLLGQAATEAFPDWIADSAAGLSGTMMSCVVFPGAGCVLAGGQVAFDYGIAILNKLVDIHPDATLTATDRANLKAIFTAVNAGVQLIGVDLLAPTKMEKVCTAIDAIATVGDVYADTIETQSTRVLVNMAVQEAQKITFIFCEIAPL